MDPATLPYAERAAALAPDLPESWQALARVLNVAGRLGDAEAALRAGLGHITHPALRAQLWASLINLLRVRGDSAEAERLTALVSAALLRDGRPALRSLAASLHPVSGNDPAFLGYLFGQLRTATAARDPLGRLAALEGIGRYHEVHGEPAAGLPALTAAVALADSIGLPYARLVAHLWRGRAEAKLGRTAAAERDLQTGLTAGAAAPEMYYLAETWHNLAHVYEGEGRWTEAARAVDHFVALTRPMRWDALRMMSLHDAGIIRWEAGWHAAARANFAEMVRVVDEQQENMYWAGEYFERVGDLARARVYYTAGAKDPSTAALPLGGLVRVFEALGQEDSAALAAARHDSLITQWSPVEHPLLPQVLARHGRAPEALALARAWATRQLNRGNVEGAALAWLGLAELALAAGTPAEALAAAERADSLAATLHLVGDVVRAGELRGTALLALGQHGPGLAALQRAARLARAHPTTDAVFSTELALGDALTSLGRGADALPAYERAAQSVDRVSALLGEDMDRAGYRERHLRPYDHALLLLLQAPATPGTVDAILRWSGRRKAAALALATTSADGSPLVARPPVDRQTLQAGLAPDDAVIDYLAIGPRLAAVVVTSTTAQLVSLPLSSDSVRQLAERLERPLVATYGRRLDLARAPFDLEIAHALYGALVAPLGAALQGTRHLTVVPDGPLHAVPFEALVSALPPAGVPNRYSAARFVLDDHDVAYAPSTELSGQGSIVASRSQVLVVERDAPGGPEEIAAITAALPPGRATVLQAASATETAVRSRLRDFDVLHFATHAEASSRDPLASRLDLGADGTNDGYFHLNEITAGRLRARLVVLSGCETLEGRLYQGEGMMGLARAFLVAGADEVVATRWPVGPATAELMGAFYRRLRAGERVGEALAGAKRALRTAPQTAHPFYWASFVLVTGRDHRKLSPQAVARAARPVSPPGSGARLGP